MFVNFLRAISGQYIKFRWGTPPPVDLKEKRFGSGINITIPDQNGTFFSSVSEKYRWFREPPIMVERGHYRPC